MSTLLFVVITLVIFIAAVLAVQPSAFRTMRWTEIDAPPSDVFAHVNDFRKWEAWSPWEKLDPATKRTYSGSTAGVGAIYEWEGNSQVGKGRMTITESRPGELIRIRMEFLKPMKATNTGEFTFLQEDEETIIIQSMSGRKGLMAKVMGIFMDMDTMVGDMFEKGLAELKRIAEADARG